MGSRQALARPVDLSDCGTQAAIGALVRAGNALWHDNGAPASMRREVQGTEDLGNRMVHVWGARLLLGMPARPHACPAALEPRGEAHNAPARGDDAHGPCGYPGG